MQKFRLSVILALFAALLLSACNSHPINKRMQIAIEGTWQGEQSGTLLTIYSDGRFILENAKGAASGALIKGKMDRGMDEVYVVYTDPKTICPDSSGIYRFSRKGKQLTWEKIRDDCATRVGQFDHTWTLKYRTPLSYLKK
jgi:hypothetical protein